MQLNNGFEYILIEDMRTDISPINRLVAYLCLRYKIQARIEITWMGSDRPQGFFDMFRNIKIITAEDDFQGLVSMTIRVHPPLAEDKETRELGIFPIPEVSFEEVGKLWFVEIAKIEMQHEKFLNFSERDEIDLNHPLLKSFARIGLKLFRDEDASSLIFKPAGKPVTVDEIMQSFLTEKPGAKSYPIDVWKNNEIDD
jgi:hypothetical protein